MHTDEAPLATVRSLRGRRILASLNDAAEDAGLRPDMALTQARAILPDLAIAEADPAADHAGLAALAGWAERYTPLAAACDPDALWLDIEGCAHLFGDEAGLAQDLLARLDAAGMPARLAIADTAGAAWALAHAPGADRAVILPSGGERAALADLPVGLLRLEERLVAALHRLGLRRIGALDKLARAELTARFGPDVALRLAQAYGSAAEPIAWPRAPAPWAERLAFAEPIGTADSLAAALQTLTASLCARLDAAQQGGVRFTAHFLRVDGGRAVIAAGLAAPARDAPRIAGLLAARIETVDPGFGIDAIVLEAETAPLAQTQAQLSTSPAAPPLAAALDDLTRRLGEGALWRSEPAGSHVPERSVATSQPLATPAWAREADTERPLRLLASPEPIDATAPVPDDPPMLFRWRGALHRIQAATGPERISAEWWRRPSPPDPNALRDYYRVEDNSGARFWVFRTGLTGTPKWFVHGVFG